MTTLKSILPFILLMAFASHASGQTMIGIKGGVSWFSLRGDQEPDQGNGFTNYTSDPSWCVTLELKGRQPKAFHMGAFVRYSQNRYNLEMQSGGHFPEGKNVNYELDYIYLAISPEFTVGKKAQLHCNIGPYLGVMIRSARNGTSYSATWYPVVYTYYPVTGSANSELKGVDFGFQESIGITCRINSWFGLSLEESGMLGFLNLNQYESPAKKSKSICLQFGVAFQFKTEEDD